MLSDVGKYLGYASKELGSELGKTLREAIRELRASNIAIFTKEEIRILERHQYKPFREIYHYTDNPEKIKRQGRLFVRAGGMLSLTANPNLRYIIPERRPRKFRMVLDFVKLKKQYGEYLFPVYYFTDYEWYETKPPVWLIKYYRSKGVHLLGQDVEDWNTAPLIYLSKDIFSYESEWKCTTDIYPIEKYLIRVDKV